MAAVTVSTDQVKVGVCPDALTPAGVVLSAQATYTATAALDANSVLQMLKLPAGAQLLQVTVQTSALGSGRTLDVGVNGTVDNLLDGVDHSSAAVSQWPKAGELETMTVTAEDTIDVKCLGDTFPDEGTCTMTALYKMSGAIDPVADYDAA